MVKCVPYYAKLISSFSNGYSTIFQPKNILDLGCGNGIVTFELLKQFPKAKYTLLDAWQQMLDLCATCFSKQNATYVCSYFEDFSFKANHYDLIVAGFSLHHCSSEEKRLLFRKIHTALSSGGVFGCSDLMISKTNSTHTEVLKQWQDFVVQNYASQDK